MYPKPIAVVYTLFLLCAALLAGCGEKNIPRSFTAVRTLGTAIDDIGEPFGIAVKGKESFVSDGANGKVWRLSDGKFMQFAVDLDTPSSIAVAPNGDLIVVDSGTRSVKRVSQSGSISVIAEHWYPR